MQVRVVGDVNSNAAGIGATVTLIQGERRWIRSIEGGSAQGNQNSLTAHFGMGDVTEIEAIEVRFIGGGLVRYDGPFEVGQRLRLTESNTVTPY